MYWIIGYLVFLLIFGLWMAYEVRNAEEMPKDEE